jgi:hypothetical protein
MPTNPEDKHLSPEEADRRLSVMAAITALIDSKNVDLLTAEDVFEIVKEVAIFGRSFFSEEFWSTRYRTKELIVGETDTSVGTPTSGTISSTEKPLYRKRIYPANPSIAAWFEDIFLVSKSLQDQCKLGDKIPEITAHKVQRPKDLLSPRARKILNGPAKGSRAISTKTGKPYPSSKDKDNQPLVPVEESARMSKAESDHMTRKAEARRNYRQRRYQKK